MDRKGFLLIEVLMGLFLLGLITVTCLPILNTALNNIILVKEKMDMLFFAESTIEQLKSFNYDLTNRDEYLFDMQLRDLIDILKEEDTVTITLPLNIEDDFYPYRCTIYKENDSKNLWKICTEVFPFDNNKKISNIKVVTIMPIPHQKD
jgi:hypothetical protein